MLAAASPAQDVVLIAACLVAAVAAAADRVLVAAAAADRVTTAAAAASHHPCTCKPHKATAELCKSWFAHTRCAPTYIVCIPWAGSARKTCSFSTCHQAGLVCWTQA
jgi:hypothetical protein